MEGGGILKSEEQKIKDDIRKEYAKTYPNIIFTLTNTLEVFKKERNELKEELDRIKGITEKDIARELFKLPEDSVGRPYQASKVIHALINGTKEE